MIYTAESGTADHFVAPPSMSGLIDVDAYLFGSRREQDS